MQRRNESMASYFGTKRTVSKLEEFDCQSLLSSCKKYTWNVERAIVGTPEEYETVSSSLSQILTVLSPSHHHRHQVIELAMEKGLAKELVDLMY